MLLNHFQKQNVKSAPKPLYFPQMPSDVFLFYSVFAALLSSSTKMMCNCLISTCFFSFWAAPVSDTLKKMLNLQTKQNISVSALEEAQPSAHFK